MIREYHAKGVPFCHHLHVPEVHPVTGAKFCEREDAGHVLKVINCCLLRISAFSLIILYFHVLEDCKVY